MNEVMFENIKFTVLAVDNKRIEKVRVEILPEENKEEDEDEDDEESTFRFSRKNNE